MASRTRAPRPRSSRSSASCASRSSTPAARATPTPKTADLAGTSSRSWRAGRGRRSSPPATASRDAANAEVERRAERRRRQARRPRSLAQAAELLLKAEDASSAIAKAGAGRRDRSHQRRLRARRCEEQYRKEAREAEAWCASAASPRRQAASTSRAAPPAGGRRDRSPPPDGLFQGRAREPARPAPATATTRAPTGELVDDAIERWRPPGGRRLPAPRSARRRMNAPTKKIDIALPRGGHAPAEQLDDVRRRWRATSRW